jgi:hypothetical protein
LFVDYGGGERMGMSVADGHPPDRAQPRRIEMEMHSKVAGCEIGHGEQRKREHDVWKHELAGSLFAPGQ